MKTFAVIFFFTAVAYAGKPMCDHYPCLQLKGKVLDDEYVDLNSIGRGSASLECRTNLINCCTKREGPYRGNWDSPNGEKLPFKFKNGNIFRENKCEAVLLSRRQNKCDKVGNYCCNIQTVDQHINGSFDKKCVYLYHKIKGAMQ